MAEQEMLPVEGRLNELAGLAVALSPSEFQTDEHYAVDRAIHDACADYDCGDDEVPHYTTSLEAAMLLIPRDGSMTMLDLTLSWEPAEPQVFPACVVRWYPPHKSGPEWHAQIDSAPSPELAVCIAALRARARAALAEAGAEVGEATLSKMEKVGDHQPCLTPAALATPEGEI